MLADVNVRCKMTSVITLDGVKLERLYKYMSTYMRKSSTFAGFLQCNGGKLEEAEDFKRAYVLRKYQGSFVTDKQAGTCRQTDRFCCSSALYVGESSANLSVNFLQNVCQ